MTGVELFGEVTFAELHLAEQSLLVIYADLHILKEYNMNPPLELDDTSL